MDDGIKVHRLGVPLMPGLNTIRSPEALLRLERILRAEKYDIVHAHTALSPLALAGVYKARKLGIPSLLTEHSVLRGAGSVMLRAADRLAYWTSWPTVISAVSEFVADELRTLTKQGNIHVLLNATRIEDWQVDHREELRVTSVMRFTRRKSPIDIVRMIPEVFARLPQHLRPRFTIIGDGPERANVEREAQALGVSDYLELPGFLPRQEIRDFLSRSAVFILPTQKEALSIVAIEARAAGLPVVARTPNGVAEVVRHGVHGFLAPTTEDFIAHLVELLRNRELRAEMSARARQGLELFGWDQAIERHMQVYGLAMQRHQHSRVAVAQGA
jgi:glycosyltransferase involved in cell wall biosynthesis